MKVTRWKYVRFADALEDKTAAGTKIQQHLFKSFGRVPIIDQGAEFIAGYSDDDSLAWKAELPVVVFGDHTRAMKYVDFPFVLGADGVKVLVPRGGLSAKFAYYYLRSLTIFSRGYARHFRHLKEVNVPIPPLMEQERIVKLLDEADELRKLRTQADLRTTALIPALFHEMFGVGDPEHTRFRVKQLADLVLPERPVTYGILKPGPDIEDGVPYVRVLDIKQNHLQIHQLLKTTKEIANQYRRSMLCPGDILVTIRGTVGRTCVVPEELRGANITQDTARLAVTPAIESIYAVEFLNTPWAQRWMSHHMLGQAVKGINLGDLRKLPVPVPPLSLQREFKSQVTEIRALLAEQTASRRRLKDLYQSLLYSAFEGEL